MQDDYQDKDGIDSLPPAGGIKMSVCAAEVVDIYSQVVNVGPVASFTFLEKPLSVLLFCFLYVINKCGSGNGEVELISFIMPFLKFLFIGNSFIEEKEKWKLVVYFLLTGKFLRWSL